MKTKLLSRLRKKYAWHFDHITNEWVLWEKEKMNLYQRKHSFHLISIMFANKWSVKESMSYYSKKMKLIDKAAYQQSKKNNPIKPTV